MNGWLRISLILLCNQFAIFVSLELLLQITSNDALCHDLLVWKWSNATTKSITKNNFIKVILCCSISSHIVGIFVWQILKMYTWINCRNKCYMYVLNRKRIEFNFANSMTEMWDKPLLMSKNTCMRMKPQNYVDVHCALFRWPIWQSAREFNLWFESIVSKIEWMHLQSKT